MIATALAAIHVLILVVSKDLGSAMIFFVTYLVMLFVSTRNPFLVLTGILAGSGAAVGAYFLFSHIRVRGRIRSRIIRAVDIRYVSHCFLSVREAGLEPDCARAHRMRFRLWNRISCFLP